MKKVLPILAVLALCAGCSGCAPNGRVVDEMEKTQWAAVSAQTNAAGAANTGEENER